MGMGWVHGKPMAHFPTDVRKNREVAAGRWRTVLGPWPEDMAPLPEHRAGGSLRIGPCSAFMRLGLAMGSNLGDRGQLLAAARDRVRALLGPRAGFLQAPLFASAPVDCPPGAPEFLNTALEFDLGGLEPIEFLHHCQKIEHAFGRPMPKDRHRNAPRPVDLDLLYLDDGTLDHSELVLPHPRMAVRRFVLEPLAHIVPDRIPGGLSLTIVAMLDGLPPDPVPLRLVAEHW